MFFRFKDFDCHRTFLLLFCERNVTFLINMRFLQPKISLALFVFILSVSPHACLVEQAIATVLHAVPYVHQGGTVQSDHADVPSYNHDREGHEEKLCCDNNLDWYLGSSTLGVLNADTSPRLLVPETTKPTEYSYHRSRLKAPTSSSRTSDRYALTCLLHAPPQL